MAKITYGEKANARTSSLPAANKFGADEANEIKASVNELYDLIISSTALTIVDSADDFPAASGGVITIPDGASYLITTDIDLLGDRFVLAGDAAFFGVSTSISRITSTGLGASVPLITSLNGLRLANIEIYSVGTALNLDASATTSALDWRDVNFRDVPTVGTIDTYDNIIFETFGFINSAGLTFSGTFGTIAFDNTIFNAASASTVLIFDANIVITRRIRIEKCAFVILSGETGINLPLTATIPNQNYILDTVNFAGGGTYLSGIDFDNNKASFIRCSGITNTNSIGGLSITNNLVATNIVTAGVAVAVAGTSTPNALNQRFSHDSANNALEYTDSTPGLFVVTATGSLTAGNNKEIGLYIAKNTTGTLAPNTDKIASSEIYATTDGTRPESFSLQSFVDLNEGDKVYIVVENETDTTDITVRYMNVIVQKAVI